MPDKIEELAEKLSLGLAEKLEKKEIDLRKMALTIQGFVIMANTGKDIKQLTDFVGKVLMMSQIHVR